MENQKKIFLCLVLIILSSCISKDKSKLYDIGERTFINTNLSENFINSIIYQYVQVNDSDMLVYNDMYLNPKKVKRKNHFETIYYIHSRNE